MQVCVETPDSWLLVACSGAAAGAEPLSPADAERLIEELQKYPVADVGSSKYVEHYLAVAVLLV